MVWKARVSSSNSSRSSSVSASPGPRSWRRTSIAPWTSRRVAAWAAAAVRPGPGRSAATTGWFGASRRRAAARSAELTLRLSGHQGAMRLRPLRPGAVAQLGRVVLAPQTERGQVGEERLPAGQHRELLGHPAGQGGAIPVVEPEPDGAGELVAVARRQHVEDLGDVL